MRQISRPPIRMDCLRTRASNHKEGAVSNSRYQTSNPSLREISLPRMPVSPARRTAICSWMNAFFNYFMGNGICPVFLFGFSYGFLGKRAHGHCIILHPVTIILEQRVPAQIKHTENAFLYNALIHLGNTKSAVFEDDRH